MHGCCEFLMTGILGRTSIIEASGISNPQRVGICVPKVLGMRLKTAWYSWLVVEAVSNLSACLGSEPKECCIPLDGIPRLTLFHGVSYCALFRFAPLKLPESMKLRKVRQLFLGKWHRQRHFWRLCSNTGTATASYTLRS